jgi:hypothetical protein
MTTALLLAALTAATLACEVNNAEFDPLALKGYSGLIVIDFSFLFFSALFGLKPKKGRDAGIDLTRTSFSSFFRATCDQTVRVILLRIKRIFELLGEGASLVLACGDFGPVCAEKVRFGPQRQVSLRAVSNYLTSTAVGEKQTRLNQLRVFLQQSRLFREIVVKRLADGLMDIVKGIDGVAIHITTGDADPLWRKLLFFSPSRPVSMVNDSDCGLIIGRRDDDSFFVFSEFDIVRGRQQAALPAAAVLDSLVDSSDGLFEDWADLGWPMLCFFLVYVGIGGSSDFDPIANRVNQREISRARRANAIRLLRPIIADEFRLDDVVAAVKAEHPAVGRLGLAAAMAQYLEAGATKRFLAKLGLSLHEVETICSKLGIGEDRQVSDQIVDEGDDAIVDAAFEEFSSALAREIQKDNRNQPAVSSTKEKKFPRRVLKK